MRAFLCFLLILTGCSGKSSKETVAVNSSESTSRSRIADPAADVLQPFLQKAGSQLTQIDTLTQKALSQMRQCSYTPDTEKIFVGFFKEYQLIVENVGEQISATPIRDDKAEESLRKTLGLHGIDLYFSEGDFYADVSNDYLLRSFGSALTPAMKEYLGLRKAEQMEGFSEDAGLTISWDKVSDRVVAWEKFLAAYPDFVWYGTASDWYSTYLRTYMTGMDNSRVFDDENVLFTEVNNSYQRFIQLYNGTKSAALLKDYYEVLKANGFHDGRPIKDFLQVHRIKSMFAVQPPVR
jgi:hypothetical protein